MRKSRAPRGLQHWQQPQRRLMRVVQLLRRRPASSANGPAANAAGDVKDTFADISAIERATMGSAHDTGRRRVPRIRRLVSRLPPPLMALPEGLTRLRIPVIGAPLFLSQP